MSQTSPRTLIMSLQPLWPCSSFLATSHIITGGEEQWSLEQWHILGVQGELGGNNSSGTAVLGMAACKIQGVVKRRDRHRVMSGAALLMGWAVSRSQHPQNSAPPGCTGEGANSCCLQLTLQCHSSCSSLECPWGHPSKGCCCLGQGWMGKTCSAIDFPPVQDWRGITWIKTVR